MHLIAIHVTCAIKTSVSVCRMCCLCLMCNAYAVFLWLSMFDGISNCVFDAPLFFSSANLCASVCLNKSEFELSEWSQTA